MMKKFWLVFLTASLVVLAGCGLREHPATIATLETEAPRETTVETVPETLPPMTAGEILADRVPGVLTFLRRGDTVELAESGEEGYLTVKTALGYGLVPANLVRSRDAEATEPWKGYAMWSMTIYDNFYLTGEGTTLNTNTPVEVLEDLGTCYLVKTDDLTGYAEKRLVSKWPASSGGGGGGGGGSSGGQDGGDIQLTAPRVDLLMDLVPQTGSVTGEALVLADETPVILGFFHRGDRVQVLDAPEAPIPGWASLYLEDGTVILVEENLIRPEGTAPYTPWDGFAGTQAKLYDNFHLSGAPVRQAWTNFQLHVVEDLGTCYMVTLEDQTLYLAKAQVSETRIPVSSGGGGGGGGPEWSDPIL